MISLLFNNWRFVLDALLIIALIILIFVLNPFGIFGGGLSLGTTTNMVTEVRQIGQLVTAEYYGEVISSLDESRLVLIEEDSTQQRANQYYSEIKYALFDLYQYQQIPKKERTQEYRDSGQEVDLWRKKVRQDVNRRNVLEKLEFHDLLEVQQTNNSFNYDPQLSPVIEFLWREKYGHTEKVDWEPSERTIREVLLTIYNELADYHQTSSDETFQSYLDDGFDFPADYQAFAFNDQVSELSRAQRKKKLTLVGRGWVKAGFDFQSLDNNSYYFHEETGELHFFGLEPQILNADINPWFIPQRGIPGFEVIDYHGKVNFKDAQRVKQHCIDKLLMYAHRANIIEQAQLQGAETLKSFFSLLTGEEVTQVHFHNDLLTQTIKEVARDEFISYYEGVLVDSVLRRELRITDSLRKTQTNRTKNLQLAIERDSLQKRAIARLRELPFGGGNNPFNYYSVLAYRIAQDSIVDQYELGELRRVRWDVSKSNNEKMLLAYKSPDYWYRDTLALMNWYNEMLSYLEQLPVTVGTTKSVRVAQSTDSLENWVSSPQLQILEYYVQDDTATVLYLDSLGIDTTGLLTELAHPFRYSPSLFESLNLADSLLSISKMSSDSIRLKRNQRSVFWVYDFDNEQLMTIGLSLDSLIQQSELGYYGAVFRDSTKLFINADSFTLSPNQLKLDSIFQIDKLGELYFYFEQLEHHYQREQNKGPIVRASEWFHQQLTQRSDSITMVDQIKDFLFKKQN